MSTTEPGLAKHFRSRFMLMVGLNFQNIKIWKMIICFVFSTGDCWHEYCKINVGGIFWCKGQTGIKQRLFLLRIRLTISHIPTFCFIIVHCFISVLYNLKETHSFIFSVERFLSYQHDQYVDWCESLCHVTNVDILSITRCHYHIWCSADIIIIITLTPLLLAWK